MNTQKVKLGDVAEITMGQSPKGETLNNEGLGTPFMQGNRTFGFLYPVIDTFTTSPTRMANKGDVVMSVRAPVGDLNIAPEDFCIGRGLCAIRSKESSNSFLYYLLKNNVSSLAHRGNGTVFSSINKNELNSFEIIVPESITTQTQIAHILSTLDDKIAVNNRLNAKLEELARTLFLDKIHKLSIEEVLLTEIATIKYGKGLATRELLDKGYPVYGGNGQIGFYSDYIYEDPQILISCRGAASGNILISPPKSYVTSNSLIIELNDRRYFEWLKQYFLLNQLHEYATGSAQPQITIDNLKFLTVPLPNFQLISSLTEKLQLISKHELLLQKESRALATLRDTLLPKLMSGEVEVRG